MLLYWYLSLRSGKLKWPNPNNLHKGQVVSHHLGAGGTTHEMLLVEAN